MPALQTLAAAVLLLGAWQDPKDDPPASPYTIVAPRPAGVIVEAINGRGDTIGFEWAELDTPGVIEQVPFFAPADGDFTRLPLLEGYTATFPEGVSDDGTVAGRVSKPMNPGVLIPLRNQAFVWDAQKGIRGLGAPEGMRTSAATGISRDGRRLVGYVVGQDQRRACVWDRIEGAEHEDERSNWRATVLAQAADLGSDQVAMSPDGRKVAALDGGVPVLWTLDDSGAWNREAIGDAGSLAPRAVNDAGTVVGLRHFGDGNSKPIVWDREGGAREIPLPALYERGEALAINGAGVVVGMIDGPRGSLIGPNGFVLEPGAEHPRILKEGGPGFASATAINDRNQIAGVVEMPEEP